MIFFEPILAQSGPTTERVITLPFNATKSWDYLFIKFSGSQVPFTIDGISYAFEPQLAPTHTDDYGNAMPKNSDGFINDHFDMIREGLGVQSGSSITIRFGGAVSVESILVLKKQLDYTDRKWNSLASYNDVETIPRGVIRQAATGRNRYVPPLNDTADAWRVPIEILFTRALESEFAEFTQFRIVYRGGFAFAVDPYFLPHLIGACLFEGNRAIRYPARWKRAGRRVRESITSV